jgi:hypothetical protein
MKNILSRVQTGREGPRRQQGGRLTAHPGHDGPVRGSDCPLPSRHSDRTVRTEVRPIREGFTSKLESESGRSGWRRRSRSGAGLQRSIEITDPPVLALSNVYDGTFIGVPATEPDAAWPRHTVAFDVQTLDGVKAAAYVVY